MKHNSFLIRAFGSMTLALGLAGCLGGGGDDSPPAPPPPSYTIGATVTGLPTGGSVVLVDGDQQMTVNANAVLSKFSQTVPAGGSYAVLVASAPAGYVCTATNNTGSGITSDVSSVSVNCSIDYYTIGGTITGLDSGQTMVLLNNGTGSTFITGGGSGTDRFTFNNEMAYMSGYNVTVAQQPANQTCSIASNSGSGSGVNADVASVTIACSNNPYTIGGAVTGLSAGQQVTLYNNGGDALVISGDAPTGNFTFATPVAFQGSYNVTVNQQPQNLTCSAAAQTAAGAGVNANVSSVVINCTPNNYAISGSVSGLAAGQTLTLANNGGTGSNAVTVTGGGTGTDAFSFAAPVSYLGSYSVAVSTQPTGESCTVASGSGSAVSADVTNVAVNCATTYNAVSALRFSAAQVANAQWNVGACTTTNTCIINSDNPGTAYLTPFTQGQFNWSSCGSGAYVAFDPNMVAGVQDTTNPYAENLYAANGTLCQSGGTGHFVSVGLGADGNAYLFYVGSDNNTGTLLSPQAQLTGAGFSFTGVHNPTIQQINQYLP